MLKITCPWCGDRAQIEFTYRGDGALTRPALDNENAKDHFEYVYLRDPRRGVQDEIWRHSAGCGQFLKVRRDTLTHKIYATSAPQDDLAQDDLDQQGDAQ
ncbi:MAG: sarcosine oxidase subunit delta [Alphaproteobacteria bacterium]|nr:sarcosine oxidase subunit delta [Alphaproteobacteria bacterium]